MIYFTFTFRIMLFTSLLERKSQVEDEESFNVGVQDENKKPTQLLLHLSPNRRHPIQAKLVKPRRLMNVRELRGKRERPNF